MPLQYGVVWATYSFQSYKMMNTYVQIRIERIRFGAKIDGESDQIHIQTQLVVIDGAINSGPNTYANFMRHTEQSSARAHFCPP